MMTLKEPLKMVYEKTTGSPISCRQWRRIKREYLQGKTNLQTVKTLAHLRRVNGRRRLVLADMTRLEGFAEFANCLDGEVTGWDIMEAFAMLSPSPSLSTIRRWGKEMGIPLVREQWYTAHQARQWIRCVGERVHFKIPQKAKRSK